MTSPIVGISRLSEAEVRDALIDGNPLWKYPWPVFAVTAALAVYLVPSFSWSMETARYSPFLILVGVFWWWLLLGPRNEARGKMAMLGAAEGDIQYHLEDEGMVIVAPGAAGTVLYRDITDCRETELVFRVTSLGATNIVPKRAFRPADLEAVRALLNARVRPARSSTKPR